MKISTPPRRVLGPVLLAAWLAAAAPAGAADHPAPPRAASASRIPWQTGSIKYVADHKDVKEILRELAASQNVMASISPQVEGNVTGNFSESPQRFLDHLAASFGFVWYYDGTVLYIAGANEARSVSIGLSHASAADLRSAIARLRVADPRFAIVYDDQTNTVLVSGPPRYVELVSELARKIDVDHQQRRALTVRVFPLRYAWAADHPLKVGGQQLTIVGVANILRSMYQKNAPMAQMAPLATPAVARVGSVAAKNEAAPQGGPAGTSFWSSALPGLGGADNAPRKPPLPGAGQGGSADGAAPLPVAAAGAATAPVEEDTPTIQPDPRTNAVLIRDLPEKMADYQRLIAALDTRPQVLEISASIIDVTENGLEQLGVDWRLHSSHLDFESGAGNNAQLAFPGSLNPNGFANPNSTDGSGNAATPTGAALTAVLGGAGRFLMARVNALEQASEARISASPKVATLDHVEAVMDNKTTFYVPVAGYQSSDLYSVSAGTSLRVLPMVVPRTGDNADGGDGQIRLTVHIEDGQLTGQLVGQLPVVSNSEIDTEALIRNGESLLIAGYSVEQSSKQNTDVPLLSRLPLLGGLFRNKQDQKQKFQRLFLLTPRIITPL
ncbi:type III secretion protein C [Duganella sp. 1411]|uniref:type III secretion system outer membrane ring subunit SctC n=1 Tax=Duganella sp. 1411 TaxID=2806572 RepID=UPI001AE9FC61|nr:type III secretion system outer membrane ring subunit SctC [Duganella sp. 1411]MBP1204789.1 type III secretion protein C [Duganella sp. 1411]